MVKPHGVIVFAGTVGSGKSTHIKMLGAALNQNQIRFKSIYLKNFMGFTHLFLKLLSKILTSHLNPHISPLRSIGEYFPRILKIIVPLAFLLDIGNLLLFSFFQLFIPLFLMKNYVIIEEYTVGAIGDVIHASIMRQIPKRLANLMLRIYLKLTPKSGIILFLDADYSSLARRWKMRGTPREPIKYLLSLRTAANLLKSIGYKVYFVNTQKDIFLVHQEILSLLLNCICGSKRNYEG